MEFREKARIRLEYWIRHNEQHLADYEAFAAAFDLGAVRIVFVVFAARHKRRVLESRESIGVTLRTQVLFLLLALPLRGHDMEQSRSSGQDQYGCRDRQSYPSIALHFFSPGTV